MFRKIIALLLVASVSVCTFTACKEKDDVKLDPKNPTTVTFWHYYNGETMMAFDNIVNDFNESIGKDKGIIVESVQMGSTNDIEAAILSSARGEAGAAELPDMFLAYADTVYTVDSLGFVAELNSYFSEKELKQFDDNFLEEGRINGDSKLKIIPIAKSTECFLLNDTDWQKFAAATGADYSDLDTMENIAQTAEEYYNWTDSLTSELYDGKALFGRDAIANMFIITSKSFDVELYGNKGNEPFLNVDETVMRKIWDYFYVPYISGYFTSIGKFRSDDVKIGELLSYIGSTASASYFPIEVTPENGQTYTIDYKVLPMPTFEGAKNVSVQQGAGVAVTKSTKESEYASCEFIKYFTKDDNNIEFSGKSGYLPVKKSALNYDVIKSKLSDFTMKPLTDSTLQVTLESINDSTFFTNKPFKNGVEARTILSDFEIKCQNDRQAVLNTISKGETLENAVAAFNTDENFNEWYTQFSTSLFLLFS
ncbi:MAG: extracellular solute-binding protein [Oscillospiraceae bacterium]|nr:extracellular solute-binding protein [Oscillospiraceae bacterium]